AAGRGQEPHGTAMTAASVSRAELVDKARRFPARTFRLFGVVLAVLGGAAFLWSFINGETARAWQSWHFNFMFWTALAQGMVVFAATQKLAKGHWSGVVIRLAEAAGAFLPVSLVLFVGLIVGRAHIFSWLRDLRPDLGSWLTVKTFFLRNGAIYVLLTWLSWRFVRRDLAPDVRELADGRPAERLDDRDAINRDAAVLVVAYAFGYSLLAFVVPFIGLLGVKPKKSPLLLTTFALVSLLGIWLERYLEIVPSINGRAAPVLGVPEIGVALLFGGLFLGSLGWFGARYPMVSPRLAADA